MAEKYPTNEDVDQPDSTSEESSCSSSDSSRSCSPEPLKPPKEVKKLIPAQSKVVKSGCILDLKSKAKCMGIRGYSRLNKKGLEDAINGHTKVEPKTIEPRAVEPTKTEPIKVSVVEPTKVVEPSRELLDQRAIVQDRLFKMKLADLKVMCKKGGITLSQYDKTKGKSVAKTRGRLIEDITAYCNKN